MVLAQLNTSNNTVHACASLQMGKQYIDRYTSLCKTKVGTLNTFLSVTLYCGLGSFIIPSNAEMFKWVIELQY